MNLNEIIFTFSALTSWLSHERQYLIICDYLTENHLHLIANILSPTVHLQGRQTVHYLCSFTGLKSTQKLTINILMLLNMQCRLRSYHSTPRTDHDPAIASRLTFLSLTHSASHRTGHCYRAARNKTGAVRRVSNFMVARFVPFRRPGLLGLAGQANNSFKNSINRSRANQAQNHESFHSRAGCYGEGGMCVRKRKQVMLWGKKHSFMQFNSNNSNHRTFVPWPWWSGLVSASWLQIKVYTEGTNRASSGGMASFGWVGWATTTKKPKTPYRCIFIHHIHSIPRAWVTANLATSKRPWRRHQRSPMDGPFSENNSAFFARFFLL